MVKVLDAHALMVFFEREPGFEKVKSLFAEALEGDNDLLMTSVNFGEVYYIILRECGQGKAQEVERLTQTIPVQIVDVDVQLAKEAARFKALKKVSYADCFAAALAKLLKGEVVTGDKEFKAFESEVKVFWIS
jgi:predicted nucleic acid-binding protein